MLKRIYALGLVSVAAMGAIALPAQADTAVIQRSTSDIYVEGEDNVGVQSTTQVNHTRRVNVRRGSAATVQDAYNGATILGEDNEVYQEQTQVNVTEEVNRRPRAHRGRRGRRGGNNINIRQH
ncbi:MAG: hypothetical protein F6J97_04210 [Leptolyngbya sp. SIO4C1]|nr:hypothetical protein [Leptolyngbya sp. SIO4C1]